MKMMVYVLKMKTGKCNKNLLYTFFAFTNKLNLFLSDPKNQNICNYDFIVIIIFGDNKIIIPYI